MTPSTKGMTSFWKFERVTLNELQGHSYEHGNRNNETHTLDIIIKHTMKLI